MSQYICPYCNRDKNEYVWWTTKEEDLVIATYEQRWQDNQSYYGIIQELSIKVNRTPNQIKSKVEKLRRSGQLIR
ncbi:hypothetical protein BhaS171_00047 [Bacillus phage vB_BhaS-171]|uniref:hypothetical protein n=1 Tax=Bacillus phage vB_BhaS-171 TaxID=1775140 RepID=UPI000744D008|nr:hypothetical protein BH781_gp47 [Bacillus phage vB_BhaS-171]ALY08103.1 hypothetical protein BhaS171_00047 [Bacillus phage vB_BhaS-171]